MALADFAPESANEGWTKASESYQNTIRQLTLEAVSHLTDVIHEYAPFSDQSFVLDNGAGSGSLASSIKHKHPSIKLLATDISLGMLEKLDSPDLPNVSTQLENAIGLHGLGDEVFTHALSSYVMVVAYFPSKWN
jgi:ubiquinone/menaquinone biosynthesis C-methylase UbiE